MKRIPLYSNRLSLENLERLRARDQGEAEEKARGTRDSEEKYKDDSRMEVFGSLEIAKGTVTG